MPFGISIAQIFTHFSWNRSIKELSSYFNRQRSSTNSVLYHLTLTYKDPAANPTPTFATSCLGKFYAAMMRTFVHKHNHTRPQYRHLLPSVFAFLDAPGSKDKSSPFLNSIRHAQDSFHHHAIVAALPPVAAKMDEYVGENTFTKLCERIKTSCLQPIGMSWTDIETVTSYAASYAFRMRDIYPDDWASVFGTGNKNAKQEPK